MASPLSNPLALLGRRIVRRNRRKRAHGDNGAGRGVQQQISRSSSDLLRGESPQMPCDGRPAAPAPRARQRLRRPGRAQRSRKKKQGQASQCRSRRTAETEADFPTSTGTWSRPASPRSVRPPPPSASSLSSQGSLTLRTVPSPTTQRDSLKTLPGTSLRASAHQRTLSLSA